MKNSILSHLESILLCTSIHPALIISLFNSGNFCQIVTEGVLKTGLGCLKYLGMLPLSNVSIIEKFLRLLILCGNPHKE